jgi:hypothetical protein
LVQLPQWFGSVTSCVHVPLQSVVPNGHLHWPFVHVEPAAQVNDGPQPPQSSVVPLPCGTPLLKSTHVPLQFTVPPAQHRPFEQSSPPLQNVPHAPQFDGSLSLFVHVPLQLSGLAPLVAWLHVWHWPSVQVLPGQSPATVQDLPAFAPPAQKPQPAGVGQILQPPPDAGPTPQWFGSVPVLVHTPHVVSFGELQTVVQVPALQNWPPGHEV